ncbi:MAG: SET domain-containing protein [Candidatus Magasanikbacteria bacterium]|jgi:uncharacterized protein|nr:SET domain-containing protein [Candidatus Magasanikbacteria bacterium]
MFVSDNQIDLSSKECSFSFFDIEKNIETKEVSANIGKGIFAKRNIKKGESIYVLAGATVSVPSIYTIPIYWDGEDVWLFVDPLPPFSNMNHSCEPNTGIKGRTVVVAMRDIQKGEHLTIDYAMIIVRYDSSLLLQTEKDLRCACGASSCKGKLGSYQALLPSLKEAYRPYISSYILDLEGAGKI